ncbi:hypothetical protein H5410_053829 [Solanum commersonii]|uniref:ubiquitinyl hydrolase 1 n=1 Tax=Solanum commersonii TaxID=4109 RepID=A0A9J5X5N1_SOLCO|nr:hypothetical protein H5410_053829 [Solanum commersonii]
MIRNPLLAKAKGLPSGSSSSHRACLVLGYLFCVIVHFRALEKPKEDDFCLELAKSDTYDEVVERVAQRLGVDDSSKIRLTPHNCYSQQPKPNPIKYRSVDHLVDMLIHYNQISDILYYEVLDIPLPELQCLKTLKVAFHHSTKDEIEILNVRLPKQSTVGDVLNEIKSKIFPLSEKIENINDQYWTLRAEEIPEEEKNLGPHDRLIHVYHFTKETPQNQMQVQNFGEPFFLVIHEGETLAEIKVRIQKKLQVSDEEFSKWKFAFLSLGRPEYLQDSDIVSNRFQLRRVFFFLNSAQAEDACILLQRRDVYGAWEQYLGLEHADNTSKRPYINQGISPPLLRPGDLVRFCRLYVFPSISFGEGDLFLFSLVRMCAAVSALALSYYTAEGKRPDNKTQVLTALGTTQCDDLHAFICMDWSLGFFESNVDVYQMIAFHINPANELFERLLRIISPFMTGINNTRKEVPVGSLKFPQQHSSPLQLLPMQLLLVSGKSRLINCLQDANKPKWEVNINEKKQTNKQGQSEG